MMDERLNIEEFARISVRCLSDALAAMNDAVKLCATDGPGKAIEYIADYLNNTDGIDEDYARACPDDWLTRWDVRLSGPSDIELDNAELRKVLAQGVKLLRTVYSSKSDFAHEAQMWVLAAEAVPE